MSTTTHFTITNRRVGFGPAAHRVLAVALWVLFVAMLLLTGSTVGRVLLGLVLLGSGPAPASADLYVKLPALFVLAGLLAGLIARFFSSWGRVGQITAVIVGYVLAAGAVWAVSAPNQALYLARTMAWGDSNAGTYLKLFPSHPLLAASVPYHFPASPDPRVAELFGKLSGSTDWN